MSSRKQLGILSLNWIWRSDRPVPCLVLHESFAQRPGARRLLVFLVYLPGLTGKVTLNRLTTCFLTRGPEQPFTAMGARRQTPDDSVFKASTFPEGQRAFPEQLGEAPAKQALEAESACGPPWLPSSQGAPQLFFQNEVTTRDFAQPFTVYKAVLHQGKAHLTPKASILYTLGVRKLRPEGIRKLKVRLRRHGGPSHYCTLASTSQPWTLGTREN